MSELLQDNLYVFYKQNRESGEELYFTLDRLKVIARQVLEGLEFIHGLNLIHCDLKPENILIKSFARFKIHIFILTIQDVKSRLLILDPAALQLMI